MERTADRRTLHFGNDFYTPTPSNARSRPPSLILFSLGLMPHLLSPADREFIADQLEPITRLPVRTAEDEAAWHAATRAVMERLETRFPDVAAVVPHQLYHYFDDADIFRKEPSFRSTWERYVLDFIRELRAPTTKT